MAPTCTRVGRLERTGRRYGRDDPKVALPSEACLGALVLRYGRVSGALLTSIMTERCKVGGAEGGGEACVGWAWRQRLRLQPWARRCCRAAP